MESEPDRREATKSIVELLRSSKGIPAREITEHLGIPGRLVSSILIRELKATASRDVNGDWWFSSGSGRRPSTDASSDCSEVSERAPIYSVGDVRKAPSAAPSVRAGSEQSSLLARLSGYYLSVLSHESLVDDHAGGVIVSRSRAEYLELACLPLGDDTVDDTRTAVEGAIRQALARFKLHGSAKMRGDGTRSLPVIGYPLLLKQTSTSRGERALMIQPLLLYEIEETADGSVQIADGRFPLLNFHALRLLTGQHGSAVMDEALSLMAELELDDAGGSSEPEDLPLELCEARPEWEWVEPVDPYLLATAPPLTELSREGIYNRAILYLNTRSPYTKGLERELAELRSADEGVLDGSALGRLIGVTAPAAPDASDRRRSDLLEVVPLNTEQRDAVSASMTGALTVITGPPGTGKSQVVTEILVNAVWQRKRVLFASKNNKAVDVVEERVNGLAAFPVLLRLGSNQALERLAGEVESVLSSRITDDGRARYGQIKSRYDELCEERRRIDEQRRRFIELRNRVDGLEQAVEGVRSSLGDELFARLRGVDSTAVDRPLAALTAAVDRATRRSAPFLVRILWSFVQGGRMDELTRVLQETAKEAQVIGVTGEWPEEGRSLLESAHLFLHVVQYRREEIERIREYDGALAELSAEEGLVELSLREWKLLQELFAVAAELWRAWLGLLPDRVDGATRRKLADYASILRLMEGDSRDNRRPSPATYAEYYRLSQEVSSTLPCWAVTSLSARGRVPFEKGMFDLLVIDEASQCDIASALPLLYRAKSAVIIGDPNQLTHISSIPKAMDRRLLEKFGLLELPRWAYSVNSLYDLASSLVEQEEIVTLRDHHRSHADIIQFSNDHFYGGQLRIATKYERLCPVPHRRHGVAWIDVQGSTRRPRDGGAENPREASAVVDEALRLLAEEEFSGSLGIVTPFRAQANLVRRMLTSRGTEVPAGRLSRVVVDTVHKFQGDECDVMILSPALSSDAVDSATRFVQSNRNLLNVAITRARSLLLIVGDRGYASTLPKGSLMRSLSDYAERLGERKAEPSEGAGSAVYPAVSSPELVSAWERVFYEALHAEGVELIPQYAVDQFLVDFALFHDERKLAIEIDGECLMQDKNPQSCREEFPTFAGAKSPRMQKAIAAPGWAAYSRNDQKTREGHHQGCTQWPLSRVSERSTSAKGRTSPR